jgi:hypothetical protein
LDYQDGNEDEGEGRVRVRVKLRGRRAWLGED